MNNGVYALPGFMTPAAKNWKSQLLTNEDGSVKLCVYVGKPGTKVYYSLGIPGWNWGFIKDAQYFIDKGYPQEVIDEVSKFADYLEEEVTELPERTVIPDIIINGWPVPITESPIAGKVYWILNIPKFVLPAGDTEVQISANGKLLKYTITRPDFSIHHGTLVGDAGFGAPEGDYVTVDSKGAITGGKLDMLEDGQYLQSDKKTLTNWSIDLPLLANGEYMFSGCSSLITFDADLTSVKNVNYMFEDCSSLTTFNSNLTSLEDGGSMFYGCTSLTTFDADLSSLANGEYMFYECSSLTTFDVDLPSLTYGYSMFYGCTSLTTFDADLTSVTYVHYMFENCTSLTTFNSNLTSLEDGGSMFTGCSSLTTFNSDLTSLIDGYCMFENCTSLTTFNSDLTSLAGGYSMFSNCQLDKESALRVLNSIPSYITSSGYYLTLGIHVDYRDDREITTAISKAEVEKKWRVTVQWNGTAGTSGVSAYGLRRGDPVYAKLGEPRKDGTARLDWGHYVTDPSEYMEFASLEEAKNYFGVTE
jgi:hypothetical protein